MPNETRYDGEQKSPASIDALISLVRDVMESRYPGAEWATVMIHIPNRDDFVIPIYPRQ